MDEIKRMVTGETTMEEFSQWLLQNPSHIQELDDLLPKEAISNPNHPAWKACSYGAYAQNGFSLYRQVNRRHNFDGSIGGP